MYIFINCRIFYSLNAQITVLHRFLYSDICIPFVENREKAENPRTQPHCSRGTRKLAIGVSLAVYVAGKIKEY